MNSGSWTLVFAVALVASLGLRAWLAPGRCGPCGHRDACHAVQATSTLPRTASRRLHAREDPPGHAAGVRNGHPARLDPFCGLDLNGFCASIFLALGCLAFASRCCAAVIAIEGVSPALALYATFGIEARFGFNRMTWRLWLADALKGLALATVIGVPLIALVLWIMAASGPLWWLWAWAAWATFNLLALVVVPTLIAPLFNRFEPLADATLGAPRLMASSVSREGSVRQGRQPRSAHAAYSPGLGGAPGRLLDTAVRLAPGGGGGLAPSRPLKSATSPGIRRCRHRLRVRAFATSVAIVFFTGIGPPERAARDGRVILLIFVARVSDLSHAARHRAFAPPRVPGQPGLCAIPTARRWPRRC